MKKEEIINNECIKWFNEEVTLRNALINIWNSAIEMAAEEAQIDHVECGINKQSITDLKFKTDEK